MRSVFFFFKGAGLCSLCVGQPIGLFRRGASFFFVCFFYHVCSVVVFTMENHGKNVCVYLRHPLMYFEDLVIIIITFTFFFLKHVSIASFVSVE